MEVLPEHIAGIAGIIIIVVPFIDGHGRVLPPDRDVGASPMVVGIEMPCAKLVADIGLGTVIGPQTVTASGNDIRIHDRLQTEIMRPTVSRHVAFGVIASGPEGGSKADCSEIGAGEGIPICKPRGNGILAHEFGHLGNPGRQRGSRSILRGYRARAVVGAFALRRDMHAGARGRALFDNPVSRRLDTGKIDLH